mmetsp:Transcript_113270/g.283712  ORF Transcript_113270/g.283712 Transcript_113270/m.283712 type:complete len:542 (+) Transcript_113270:83-1708(+)|eukprot:CAMPEP_0115638162 /NCGR_PEP_ID=MMETSP0272-20121206/34584_1 /TAXON_ID=71861 /ORGANISM="Scrippsiella trochoidea, Strain CCMP3099" /LENGTH=541 /DNA_ID=CAMNT_0003075273 /DNA_START=36 /DNA_END=1661 /DNA_ORIENTATION=+
MCSLRRCVERCCGWGAGGAREPLITPAPSNPPGTAAELGATTAGGGLANLIEGLSCIPAAGVQFPDSPASVIIFGSRKDVQPIAVARVKRAMAANPSCDVLVTGTSAEARAIEAALVNDAGLDRQRLHVDEWARTTEDNARWAASKLRRLGKIEAPCVLVTFPVLTASAVAALEAHGLQRMHVSPAFAPAEVDEQLGGKVAQGWVEAKAQQQQANEWAGKPKTPPKLRIIVEASSTNSGENGKFAWALMQSLGGDVASARTLVVVKAALMERRALCTLRKNIRDAMRAEAMAFPTPILVPFAPTVAELDATGVVQLAAAEYSRLETYSGPEPAKKHFLDLDDDDAGSVPLGPEGAELERSVSAQQCAQRARELEQLGGTLTLDDVRRLAPSCTEEELTGVRADAVLCFGDPTDLSAPVRAAEALALSGAHLLVVSGAFGPKGPHALRAEVEAQAARDGAEPWRHTRKWAGLAAPWPMELPGPEGAVEVDPKKVAEPRAARFLTEADCYLELALGELERRGFFEGGPLGKLERADVSIERDS